jgi:hypothetical protein
VHVAEVGSATWAHVCAAGAHVASPAPDEVSGVKVQWFAARHASAVAAVVAHVCAAGVHDAGVAAVKAQWFEARHAAAVAAVVAHVCAVGEQVGPELP